MSGLPLPPVLATRPGTSTRRRQRELASAPSRILVVKLADIGDVLLITPALRALRARYPQARIDVLTTKNGQQALSRSCFHNDVILFDKHRFDLIGTSASPRAVGPALQLAWRLRRGNYDTLVLPNHLATRWGALKFILLALASGARTRVGLDNGRGWFLTRAVEDRGFGAVPERRYWLRVAAALDADSDDDRPVFELTAGDRRNAAMLLARARKQPEQQVVIIHPSTGPYAPSRQWPAERFAALADDLVARHDVAIVLVGGADAAAATATVAQLMSAPALDLAGRTALPVTAGLLAACDLVVGNDSAIAQLAGAFGTPLLAIFGPSNEAAWGPYGTVPVCLPLGSDDLPATDHSSLTIRSADPHAPCLYVGFSAGNTAGCPDCQCMTGVDVARISRLASRLLGGSTSADRRAG